MLKHHCLTKQSLLTLLFTLSLLVGLGLGSITSVTGLRSVAVAQVGADHLIQQGVERYRSRDFAAAITVWQAVLTDYQKGNNLQQVATTLENLARAHQALGQTSAELQLWQQAESAYRELSNRLRVGRMLTEQAQAYSRLGQSAKVIEILCGDSPTCRAESALGISQMLSLFYHSKQRVFRMGISLSIPD